MMKELQDKALRNKADLDTLYEAGKQAGGGGGNTDALKTLVSSIIDRSVTEITPEDIDLLGITSLGWSAFENCANLKRFISTAEQNISTMNSAFERCTSLLEAHITNLYGGSTFLNCSKLQKVVLHSDSTFAWGVFNGCNSLRVIDYRNATKIPTISAPSGVFQNVPNGCQFVIPDALYDQWIVATNWVAAENLVFVKASEYTEYEVVE